MEADIQGISGKADSGKIRLFEFGEEAVPLKDSLSQLTARRPSTRVDTAIKTMLNSLGSGDVAGAVLLLSDGHDLELVHPAKTGASARARRIPVFAVPLGRQGKVRDVATHIVSYSPYCYTKQTARVAASLRLVGCEFESIRVQLLRVESRAEPSGQCR